MLQLSEFNLNYNANQNYSDINGFRTIEKLCSAMQYDTSQPKSTRHFVLKSSSKLLAKNYYVTDCRDSGVKLACQLA